MNRFNPFTKEEIQKLKIMFWGLRLLAYYGPYSLQWFVYRNGGPYSSTFKKLWDEETFSLSEIVYDMVMGNVSYSDYRKLTIKFYLVWGVNIALRRWLPK